MSDEITDEITDEMTDEPTKGARTRKKLIETTGALLRCQGYHATGLSQIVAASGAPRGSLYFHFPGGKDDLAIAALEASSGEWRARMQAAVAGAADLPGAIDAIVTAVADRLEASGWEHGCPVAAVALESISAPVRRTVERHFESWMELSVGLLTAHGIAEPVARQLSLAAVSGLEGALLLARVMRSREPLLVMGQALRTMAAMAIAAPAPDQRASAKPVAAKPARTKHVSSKPATAALRKR
jgi:TetR/AcrR family transcriptional repressor of lmrAB and yxaGH operons